MNVLKVYLYILFLISVLKGKRNNKRKNKKYDTVKLISLINRGVNFGVLPGNDLNLKLIEKKNVSALLRVAVPPRGCIDMMLREFWSNL